MVETSKTLTITILPPDEDVPSESAGDTIKPEPSKPISPVPTQDTSITQIIPRGVSAPVVGLGVLILTILLVVLLRR